MSFEIRYINVFDDINVSNIDELSNFYAQADVQIDTGIKLPESNTVQNVSNGLRLFGGMNPDSIKKHLMSSCGMTNEAAQLISSNIIDEMSMLVPNRNALESNYVKIACWLKTIFSNACTGNKQVFIQGKLGKYEIYTAYLLSKLSNNIVLIDEGYSADKYKIYKNIILNISNTSERLRVVTVDVLTFEDIIDMLSGNEGKQTKFGSKTLVLGDDNLDKIRSVLYGVYAESKPFLTLFKDGIQKVSYEEASKYPIHRATSIDNLIKGVSGSGYIVKDGISTAKVISYISEILNSYSNITQAQNLLQSFVVFYNRYEIAKKVVVYYGKLSKAVNIYLSFLSYIGKDVVVFDQTGESKKEEFSHDWNIIEAGEYIEDPEYPTIPVVSTIAYNAAQELSETMFNGETPGLYKTMQFETCSILEMKTTFDEMLILWDQENQLRSQFNTSRNEAIIPVMFKALLGVSENYASLVSKVQTEHSVIVYGVEYILTDMQNCMKISQAACVNGVEFNGQKKIVNNGKVSIKTITQYKNYTYKHLSNAASIHILSKIKELIEENWVKHPGIPEDKFVDMVLNIGLNLSTRIQQEIQGYDYTKKAPKYIVYANGTKQLGIQESILLTLLHLCGWDIVIFIPTGYNILGDNLKEDVVQQHIIGEMKFDIDFSTLNTKPEEKKGFFSRLFG